MVGEASQALRGLQHDLGQQSYKYATDQMNISKWREACAGAAETKQNGKANL